MYPRAYANYTLLERLAAGGMSEVDLARRSVDDAGYVRFLVIKRIRANRSEDESFVRMFKDEARITSELRHTNIAQVYDFGRVGDEYYLALEYVPGTDLRALLNALRDRRQRMPVRMALRIAHDVLAALHYAHTRTDSRGRPMDIIHRDVNPRNIMLSVTGEVKLIDFGVAKAADRLERTQTDHFKGKVAYMAPEQVQGLELDHRVDVFALGLTVYEMLMGNGAFAGLDQTQILFRILQGQLPSLSVPREWGRAGRELADVVNRSMRPEPRDRFADADDMRAAVARVAESFGGLPSAQETRAWMLEIDPGLEQRLNAKMESWSGEMGDEARPLDLDATGTLGSAPMTRSSASGSFSRSMVMAAGVGTAGLVLTLVAVGGVIGGVGAMMWWTSTKDLPSSAPPRVPSDQVEAAPADADPSDAPKLSLGVTRRTADDGTPPEPAVVVPVSADVRPSASKSPTAGEPTSVSPKVTDPEPVRTHQPEPVIEPATKPEPVVQAVVEPAPPPEPSAPVATGMLRLISVSGDNGRAVFIDGKRTDLVTGQRDLASWPVGTYTIHAEGHQPVVVTIIPKVVNNVKLQP